MVEVEGEVRMARGRRGIDEERIRRIIQAVTMAVLVGLGKAVEDEDRKEGQGPSCVMYMVASMVMLGVLAQVIMSIFRRPIFAAAVFLKRKVARRLKGESVEKRGKKRKMSAAPESEARQEEVGVERSEPQREGSEILVFQAKK